VRVFDLLDGERHGAGCAPHLQMQAANTSSGSQARGNMNEVRQAAVEVVENLGRCGGVILGLGGGELRRGEVGLAHGLWCVPCLLLLGVGGMAGWDRSGALLISVNQGD